MNQRASDAWGAMWSVVDWARKWQISETQAHNLRKHPKFPPDATVVIGARCVRFRAELELHAVFPRDPLLAEPSQA
jgi:hypothetical protein